MEKKVWTIVIGFMLVLIMIGTYQLGRDDGYREGYDLAHAEGDIRVNMAIQKSRLNDIPEYEPPMTDDERMEMLLDRLIDGIDTANMTIEFDNDGYAKGFISIYYRRPIESVTWISEDGPTFQYDSVPDEETLFEKWLNSK